MSLTSTDTHTPRTGGDPWASRVADRHQNPGGTVARRWADAGVRPLAPEVVATGWLSALLVRHDWTTVWASTDPNLRLACGQQWLDGLDRAGDNVTAWSLAAEVPHIGMWAPFADRQFSRWSADLRATGASARTGSDLPVPRVTDRHQLGSGARADVGRALCVVAIESTGPTRHLTLRLRDRWRVAGLGTGVLQPGWPTRWLDLGESRELRDTLGA